jgi:hypothetical protein
VARSKIEYGLQRLSCETSMSQPQPQPAPTAKSKGQKRSQERGSAQRSKKNPGKRPRQGGS